LPSARLDFGGAQPQAPAKNKPPCYNIIKQHHSPSSRQPVEISKKRSESLLTTAFLFDIKESKNGIHRAPYQSARNYIKLPSDEF
jgi:hypothetical protein